MTTAANLTVVRRSIVGDASGSDTLVLYCKDAASPNAIVTNILTIPAPSPGDETTYVKGYTFTPTLAAPASAAAPASSASTSAPAPASA